jgi:uncharacterized protein (TIGR02996 family)
MKEEAAFIAALQAGWEQEITWLAYADWLEEHGDSLRAEYLRVHAALRPDLERYDPKDRPLWTKWRALRDSPIDPWWLLSIDPRLAAPAGLSARGHEAIRILLGMLVRHKLLFPAWNRAFFRPDEAPAAGAAPSAFPPPAVLLLRKYNVGGVGACFCSLGARSPALYNESRRALLSGGFTYRVVPVEWIVVEDAWADA